MSAMTGGCACGAVSFSVDAPPVWSAYCHCRDCRRATGAPVSLWVGFAAPAVELSGPAAWRVGRTAAVARAFCGICGTPLAYRDTTLPDDEIYISIGAFDAPQAIEPEAHAWWQERLPYVAVDDTLPKFETFSRRRAEAARTGS